MTFILREAKRDDIPCIARICVAAFHPSTDAITRQLFPSHGNSEYSIDEAHFLWREMRKSASVESERAVVVVAVDDALEIIVGFALWEPPLDAEPPEREAAPKYHPPPKHMDQIALENLRSIASADAVETFGEKGTRDAWHLDYLAVDPLHQRRGIGRFLLDWGVQRAMDKAKDCYLIATPAGRPLYLSAGFQDVRTVHIFNTTHYSMILRCA